MNPVNKHPENVPSRRALLGGTAALLAGAVVTATTIAPQNGGASPDAELIALCAEIDALEDKIDSFTIKGATIEEEEAQDKLAQPFADEQEPLIVQLCDMPATTIEGIRARARTLVKWAPDWRNKRGGYDAAMISALLSDLIGEARA
jgi:hypothetical protein